MGRKKVTLDSVGPDLGSIPYFNTADIGGKAYYKACRRKRGAMFVSVLYWILGAYALMWGVILWYR